MECPRQDEVLVGADLIQPALVKGPIVNQAAGLVYDYESEDGPGNYPFTSVLVHVGQGMKMKTGLRRTLW